jgi:DNA-binding PadR family transcriptional regulator
MRGMLFLPLRSSRELLREFDSMVQQAMEKEGRSRIERALLAVLSYEWMAGLDVHRSVEYVFQSAITYASVYDALRDLEAEGKVTSIVHRGNGDGVWLPYKAYRLAEAK